VTVFSAAIISASFPPAICTIWALKAFLASASSFAFWSLAAGFAFWSGFTSVITVDSNIAECYGGESFETIVAGGEAGAVFIYFLAFAIALAIMASLSEADIAPLDLNSAFYKLLPSFLSFSTTLTSCLVSDSFLSISFSDFFNSFYFLTRSFWDGVPGVVATAS